MYAVSFDFNSDDLKKEFGKNYNNKAYDKIEKIFEKFGFSWLNGSVYINYSKKNSLTEVYKAINMLSTIYWFKKSVRNIKVFKISDLSDFTLAVK